jgi:NCAIR mutase (PurE)-related protein
MVESDADGVFAVGNRELQHDHGRAERTGVAEAVHAPGKTPRQCARTPSADCSAVPAMGPYC